MDQAEAFLCQARSDFRIYEDLLSRGDQFPVCHALQHLQMSTEKLSKSALLSLGEKHVDSHVAFRKLEQYLKSPAIARKFGYKNNPQAFKHLIIRCGRNDWFKSIERLSPSVGASIGYNSDSNVEYPWEARDTSGNLIWYAPVHHDFVIARELRSKDGQEFIGIIRRLLDRLPDIIIP